MEFILLPEMLFNKSGAERAGVYKRTRCRLDAEEVVRM